MPVRYSIRNQYVNSFVKRFFSSKPIVPDLDRQFLRFIRNFGFFAHIDAGKTTISEAVLFNGNEIKTRGSVDEGTTIMDFNDMERSRGITIRSAATCLRWGDYMYNLIDTPGHVDFSGEVARAVRVLDGAVILLDSVRGVEAQTETVWRQCSSQKLPRIFFFNKLDRLGSSIERCLQSIEKRFRVKPLLITSSYPVNKPPKCIIDLPTMTAYFTKNPDARNGLNGSHEMLEKRIQIGSGSVHESEVLMEWVSDAWQKRHALVEFLSDYDDSLLEKFLQDGDSKNIAAEEINNLLAKLTLETAENQKSSNTPKVVVALSGSGWTNQGVCNLMDAVSKYLPSPVNARAYHATFAEDTSTSEKTLNKITKTQNTNNLSQNISATSAIDEESNLVIPQSNVPFVGVVFKVEFTNLATMKNTAANSKRDRVAYVRAVSGVVRAGDSLVIGRTGKSESVSRISRPKASQHVDMSQLAVGDIGILRGLRDVRTGDTIYHACVSNPTPFQVLDPEGFGLPPVCVAAFSVPSSQSEERLLPNALHELTIEDPSLHFSPPDVEGAQLMLWGAGDLHLEVAEARLKERGLNAEKGKCFVAYRELLAACSPAGAIFDGLLLPSVIVSRLHTFTQGGQVHEVLIQLRITIRPLQDAISNVKRVLGLETNQHHASDGLQRREMQVAIKRALSTMPEHISCRVTRLQDEINLTASTCKKITSDSLPSATNSDENSETSLSASQLLIVSSSDDHFACRVLVNPLALRARAEAVGSRPPPKTAVDSASRALLHALKGGPAAGYPLIGVDVELLHMPWTQKASTSAARAAASTLVRSAFHCQSNLFESSIIEPTMAVLVESPQDSFSQLSSDLVVNRRAIIIESGSVAALAQGAGTEGQLRPGLTNSEDPYGFMSAIVAAVPLASLEKYAGTVRSMTSGLGRLEMGVCGYVETDTQNIKRRHGGVAPSEFEIIADDEMTE